MRCYIDLNNVLRCFREYSRAEEEFIIKYIARHHPSEKGRKGNAIYQSMATDVRCRAVLV